jgi:AP-3 complex subunit beta
LADIDEWSQVVVLEVLTRYIRCHFENPLPAPLPDSASRDRQHVVGTTPSTSRRKVSRRKKAFYSDDEADSSDGDELQVEEARPEAGSVFSNSVDPATDSRFQSDHKMALRASMPLLKSRNAAVVLAVCCLHFYCGSSDDANSTAQISKALVRILRNRRETQAVVLRSILAMAQLRPHLFAGYVADFFVKASDPMYNR